MAPTASDGDATRQRLLDATAALIVERGWGGVSTRSVADLAGVKPGVVHYHFGSVDDLKRLASLAALRGMIDPFVEVVQELPPRQVLAEIARASVEEYGPDTDVATLVYEVIPAAARDASLQSDLREVLGRFREALAGAIRRWHPTPTADPDVLAELLASAVDGLQLHLLAQPELDLPRHLEPLLDLLGPERQP